MYRPLSDTPRVATKQTSVTLCFLLFLYFIFMQLWSKRFMLHLQTTKQSKCRTPICSPVLWRASEDQGCSATFASVLSMFLFLNSFSYSSLILCFCYWFVRVSLPLMQSLMTTITSAWLTIFNYNKVYPSFAVFSLYVWSRNLNFSKTSLYFFVC